MPRKVRSKSPAVMKAPAPEPAPAPEEPAAPSEADVLRDSLKASRRSKN